MSGGSSRKRFSAARKQQCANSLLRLIKSQLKERSGGRADPGESLKLLARDKATAAEERFLAEELLSVRNIAAHFDDEQIDVEGLVWAFDTARLLMAQIRQFDTASRVLRRQRAWFLDRAVGARTAGASPAPPRDENDIRQALKDVLSRALADVIAGRPTQHNGIRWPRNLGSRLRAGGQHDCDTLLGVLAETWLGKLGDWDPGNPEHWHPFACRAAAALVLACCKELHFSLAGETDAHLGGLARELATARTLLKSAGCTEADEISGLLAELWRGRTIPTPPAAQAPRMAFARAGRDEAWKAITTAAKERRAVIFEIVGDAAQGKSQFIDELKAYLLEKSYLTFHVDASVDPAGFIASLHKKLKESEILTDPYRQEVAGRLPSDAAAEFLEASIMDAVYEIDVLANHHRVAILLNAPRKDLVHELQDKLRYLPSALIVYAHLDDPEFDLRPAVKRERYEFGALNDDDIVPFAWRLLHPDDDAPTGEQSQDPAVIAVKKMVRPDPDPVVIASLTEIIRACRDDDDFAIDRDDIPATIQRFVDAQACRIAERPGTPSIFDCLVVMPRIGRPEVLAALLANDGAAPVEPAAARAVFDWLKGFTFIDSSDDGAIALHDRIRSLAHVDHEDVIRIHQAAAKYFRRRVEGNTGADTAAPWYEWDWIDDSVVRADIYDWLLHAGELGIVSSADQLRMIGLFLDAFWWYAADGQNDFTATLLERYGRLDSFTWLKPLDSLNRSYVGRFDPSPRNAVEKCAKARKAFSDLVKAVDDLTRALPDGDRHRRDLNRIEIIIKLLDGAATWRGRTPDDEQDEQIRAVEASEIYDSASAKCDGLGEFGTWLKLWADLYHFQMLTVAEPPVEPERMIELLEERTRALGENEVRVELAQLSGEIAWEQAMQAKDNHEPERARKDLSRALDCYGRAVLHGYIFQVMHNHQNAKAPSAYTRSQYTSVLEEARRHFNMARQWDPSVAEAALDRYLLLFERFWSATNAEGHSPVGRWPARVFPPAPSDRDLYAPQTFIAQVRAMSEAMTEELNQRVDAPIECRNPVALRPANSGDADQIVDLGSEVFAAENIDSPYRIWAKQVIDDVLRDADGTCYVAEANNIIVGFALTSLTPTACWARLDCLVTRADYRCRGVAYRLADAVRERMRGLKRTPLITDVFTDDEFAVEMGFEPWTTYKQELDKEALNGEVDETAKTAGVS
jgi:N-acetylglutamate synthase-like GNAT family acetyltransferase